MNSGKSPRLNKSLDERLRGNRRLAQLRRFTSRNHTLGDLTNRKSLKINFAERGRDFEK